MTEILIGRQPIFDRKLDVYAYELLFRGNDLDWQDPASGDLATSRVIVNAFTEIGLDKLVSNKRAFLNLTRAFITGEHPLPIEPSSVVLEVLETVEPEPAVLEGLARLKKAGFKIALDDFVLNSSTSAFVPFADLIKLDVLGLSDDEIRVQVEALQPYGVPLLAEKVETREQLEACKQLGFVYFQGFFLERPCELKSKSIGAGQLTLLSLLHELHSPEFNFTRAEEIVQQDVGLCYRLLRHINSALYGMPRQIESIRETLVYMGIENVQNITSLFLLAADSSVPGELVSGAMLRARMCESLGKEQGDPEYRLYFIVGLFSTLDAIMQVPMEDLLAKLPLSDRQKEAIEKGTGTMGDALAVAQAFEHGDWDRVLESEVSPERIQRIYLEALDWVAVVKDPSVRAAA